MPLAAGTKLGPYEIADQLGAGGMGEVYRATDTRLDRTVAIKVLPEHLADRADLRERFEREAKAVSSLNHPHICTLHDIGEQDGIHYLVMEYVDGETLQQQLEKGRMRSGRASIGRETRMLPKLEGHPASTLVPTYGSYIKASTANPAQCKSWG